jgi:hypothetical protein
MEDAMKLYSVTTLVPEHDGCRDVTFSWFKTEPTGAARPYRDLIDGYDDATYGAAYEKGRIDELFTEDEAAQLVAYLAAAHEGVGTTTTKEVSLPIPNGRMGFGAVPVGGGNDLYGLYKEPDYSLPFEVMGALNLRGCVLADGSGVFRGRYLKLDTRAGDASWHTDIEAIR